MDSTSQTPRKSKRRFRPGPPPTPSLQRIAPTIDTEAAEEEDNRKAAKQIAKRIGIGRGRTKTETKAAAEVAFQPDSTSLTIRSFGVPKEEEDNRGSDVVNPSSSSLDIVSSGSPRNDGEEVHTLVTRTQGDYVEPWDYENSYYPTVLPLREPYSGDPELLDRKEFGEVAAHPDYDESTINSAEELGLTLEQHCKKQMFLFKFPDSLPVMKKKTGANTRKSAPDYSKRSNPFEGLPEGFVGKMLVYKNGAVKLKLGDVLFDVSPGLNTKMHNDVATIDTKARNCCVVGSSAKFVTVTPDVESLLNSASDMKPQK